MEFVRSIKRTFKKGSGGVIKISLLGIALAASLTLISKINYELSYENFVSELNSTYRISSIFGEDGEGGSPFDNTPGGIAPEFQRLSSTVDFVTRVSLMRQSSSVKAVRNSSNDAQMLSCRRIVAADSTVFDIFDVERIGADPIESIKDNVFISYSLASKLTSSDDISSLLGEEIVTEEKAVYRVSGIFHDFPSKSYMSGIDIIMPISQMGFGLDNLAGNERYSSFARLKPNADITQASSDIAAMSRELRGRFDNDASYILTPLADFHRDKPEVQNSVTILSALALMILIVAIMNYILITISTLVERSKEIALYKCYGAPRRVIYKMLLSDAFVAIILSLALSLSLVLLFRSEIESVTGFMFSDIFDTDAIPLLLVTLLLTFMVCGVIPAYIYSKVPLIAAFQRHQRRRVFFKRSLLTLQLAGATFFITLLTVAAVQYHYLLNLDIGYSYDDIATISVAKLSEQDRELLERELLQDPQIESVSYSSMTLVDNGAGNSVISEDGETLFQVRDLFVADHNFADLYDMELIDGRNFDPISPEGREVLVSESFVKQMSQHKDWSDGAIGKEFNILSHSSPTDLYRVCGVYRDCIVGSGANIDERPTLLFFRETEEGFWRDYITSLSIKVIGGITPEVTARINKRLTELFPNNSMFVEDYSARVENIYVDNKQARDLVLISTLIVLIITLIGIASYNRDEIVSRRSEIAIRKIHGASVMQIIDIFIRELLWILPIGLISGLIATHFGVDMLLERVSNKVALTPWIVVLSGFVVVLVIAIVMVSTTYKTASSNPVNNLS